MEHTHVECCNMLLTLGSSSIRSGTNARAYTLHYRGRRHPGAIVFRRLQEFLLETRNLTPKAYVRAYRLRTLQTPANEDAIIAAVEKEP
jgi:hypothetical protein